MKELNCTIIEKHFINHNTFLIKLENKEIPPAKVSCFAKIKDKPYTPIEITENSLLFLIKEYPQGTASKYIASKKEGDQLIIEFPYFKLEFKERKNVLMIAGGTGITPMIQILNESSDKSNYTVMFFNKSDEDIFYKEELEKMADTLFYVEKGSFSLGVPSLDNIKKVVEERNIEFVYVCGPPGMMECVSGKKNFDKSQGELKGILKEIGFNENNVYKF